MNIHFCVHAQFLIGIALVVVKHAHGLIEDNLFPSEINMLSEVEQGYTGVEYTKKNKW